MSRQSRGGARSVAPMNRQEITQRWTLNPDRVLGRRLELGMRQNELAARVGISPQHMNDIEHGRRHGSPPVRKAIADALGISLKSLCKP